MSQKFLSSVALTGISSGSILKVNSSGVIVAAVDGTDYNTGGSQWTTSGNNIYYSTGNVGINESSPSYTLHIGGTFRASGNSSIGGNLGIGTTSPGGILDVQQSSTGNILARVWNINTSGTGSSSIRIANSGNNSNGSRLEFTDNDYYVATISGDRNQGLVFRTSATGASPTGISEQMRITTAGNVGIGETSPDGLLHIKGSAQATEFYIESSTGTASTSGAIKIAQNNRSAEDFAGEMVFYVQDTNVGGTYWREAMAIINNGNVGIGNSSPGNNRLKVTGATEITGNLTLSGLGAGFLKTDANGAVSVDTSTYLTSYTETDTLDSVTDRGATTTNAITVGNYINFTTGSSIPVAAVSHHTNGYLYIKGGTGGAAIGDDGYGTSIYLPDSGDIQFTAGASERMRITSTGNVGIGTTSPSAKLDVNGEFSFLGGVNGYWLKGVQGNSAPGGNSPFLALVNNNTISSATYGWLFYDSNSDGSFNLYRRNNSTTSSQVLTISRSTGNVGIGTTAPGSTFTVVGSNTSSVPLLDLTTSGSGAWQRGVRLLNTGMSAGDSIMMAVGNRDNSKNMGQFYFYYAGNASNSNRISMGLHSVDDVFNILGTGNVGIGTTSPSTKFVVSNGGAAGLEFAPTGGTGNDAYIQSYNRSTSTYENLTYYANDHYFNYGGTTNVIINASGNVGIGTTSPVTKLDVVGDAYIYDSSVTASGLRIDTGTANLVKLRVGYPGDWANADVQIQSSTTSGLDTGIYLKAGGNVGIGTTSPSYKLHVNGSGYFENQLTVSDSLTAEALFQRNSNYSNVRITGLTASGTQERRWTIARLYFTPNHWGAHNMIKIRLVSEYYNSGYVEYNLHTYYGMGNGNSALYYLTDKGGYLGDGGAAGMKISLGSVTLASWTSGSQNTYYQDVYVDVNDYMQATAHIECLGIDYATSNPTSSADGYNVFVVYTSPSVANFTWDEFDYSSSYFGSAKIWNSSNDGASSGLDADLLDGNHASAFALASHTHSEYYPSTGGTLTGDLTITKDSPWISINKQGSAITTQEGGIRWQYKGTNIFYFYSDNADDGSLKIQSASVAGESDATPRLIIPRSNKDLYLAVSGGNVGIGTTSPSYRLHVADSTASGRAVFGYQTATSGNNYGAVFAAEGSGADKNIGLYATAQGATANYAALFDKGNVGIGTTTPIDVLHVHKPGANTRLVVGNNAAYDQFIYFQGNTDWSMGIDASNSNAFTLSNYSSIGTSNRLTVTTGGNVGIGTTSPSSILQVGAGSFSATNSAYQSIDAGAAAILFRNAYDAYLTFNTTYSASGWVNKYSSYKSGIVSVVDGKFQVDLGTGTTAGSGSSLSTKFVILNNGNVGIGTTSPSYKLDVVTGGDASVMRLLGSTGNQTYFGFDGGGGYIETNGASTARQKLRFQSYNGSAYTQLFIDGGNQYIYTSSNVNVGIGTTSPQKKLTIGSAQGDGIQFTYDSTNNYRNQILNYWNSNTDSRMDFNIARTSGQTPETIMSVGYGGNVGIGTTSPTQKLDVNGNIIADAYLGRASTSASDTGSGFASYDVVSSATGAGLYQITIVANPNSSGSGSYADYLYGKVIIGTGWNGSNVTNYIHYVQENPDPRSLYPSGGGNMTVEAFFAVNDVESSTITNGTSYTIRIKISGYVNAGAGTVVRTQKLG